MNWIDRICRRLRDKLSFWLSPPYKTCFVEGDLPKHLAPKTIYVVQEDGYLWHASMLCPCKCGEVLHMNLIPDERPCWRLSKHDDGTVSLHPSVWRKKDCRSHFWFRYGRVCWS